MSLPNGADRVLLGALVELGHVRVQATLTESSSVDERRDSEPLRETPKFTERWCPLLEIHEVGENPAFCKEPKGLPCVSVFLGTEYLDLSGLGSRAGHFRLAWLALKNARGWETPGASGE